MNGSNTDHKFKTLEIGNLQISESSTVLGLAQLPAYGIPLPTRDFPNHEPRDFPKLP